LERLGQPGRNASSPYSQRALGAVKEAAIKGGLLSPPLSRNLKSCFFAIALIPGAQCMCNWPYGTHLYHSTSLEKKTELQAQCCTQMYNPSDSVCPWGQNCFAEVFGKVQRLLLVEQG
jgi:hypothetical protein